MSARKDTRPPARAALVKTITAALADMKAVNIKVMDVRNVTDVADCMIIASGTSDRHVRSIADRVLERAKAGGFRPFGLEGERDGEWVLVDLNDVIVHVMLPRVREFYGLEGLWDIVPKSAARKAAGKPKAKAKAAGKAAGKTRPRSAAAKGKSAPARAKRPAAKAAPDRRKSAARKPASRAKTSRSPGR
jgi:ribosome-associated protein